MTFAPRPVRPDRRERRPAWACLVRAPLVMVAVLTISSPAGAYVRARDDKTYAPFFWSDPRQVLELATPSPDVKVSINDFRAAAQAALDSWSASSISCTGVHLTLAHDATDSQIEGHDGRNRIIMRTGVWGHDAAAVALTSLFTRIHPGAPDDGQIMEADIEVNAAGEYQWGVIPDGPISGRDFSNIYDLTSVLTHETGHFIGLAHTCMTPGAPLLTDNNGVAPPSCSSIPSDQQSMVEDATMYPYMNPADVKLRTLTPDDARAACDIYPTWSVPIDEWIGGGGCSELPITSSRDLTQVLFAQFFLGLLWLVSRRPRRSIRACAWRNPAPTARNRRCPDGGHRSVARAATPRNDS